MTYITRQYVATDSKTGLTASSIRGEQAALRRLNDKVARHYIREERKKRALEVLGLAVGFALILCGEGLCDLLFSIL